jgi:RsiW-degrading membrane proteinase PrsW (M82 family)
MPSTGVLVILAIIPAIIIIAFIYHKDKAEKEPLGLLVSLFIMGATISVIGAMVAEGVMQKGLQEVIAEGTTGYNFIMCFFIVALSEEGFKFLVLKWGSWRSPEFNCKFDGVVYAVAVSLGFALWENIQYVISYGFQTALIRAVTAVPGHASFGVIMGAWYGLAKRKQAQGWDSASRLARIFAVVVPAIVHGAYDFIATANTSSIHFIVFVILMFIVCFYTVKRVSGDDRYHGE